jgi:(p)ppGpp synthase/HD superfamily hydrolase
MTGYSDRINHALAFAAKHHDRQVRKGLRLPYLTQPANVAIILTRYGCDEDTVVAGILHDVIEDCVTEGWTNEMLSDRVAEKFGSVAVETALAVTKRRFNDDGAELDTEEKRSDYLRRLAAASNRARWVSAAANLHSGNSLLADLGRTVDADSVWSRFFTPRAEIIAWYRAVHDRLREVGFRVPVLDELGDMAAALEKYRGAGPSYADAG